MWAAVDSVGIDEQPQRDHNKFHILYFLLLVVIFAFFLLNLFVGVVVTTFNQEKELQGRNFLLTKTQKEWISMKNRILKTKPAIIKRAENANLFRQACLFVTNHKWFDNFISMCIILNTIVLCVKWATMSDQTSSITVVFNYVFSTIFTVEAIIKINA